MPLATRRAERRGDAGEPLKQMPPVVGKVESLTVAYGPAWNGLIFFAVSLTLPLSIFRELRKGGEYRPIGVHPDPATSRPGSQAGTKRPENELRARARA